MELRQGAEPWLCLGVVDSDLYGMGQLLIYFSMLEWRVFGVEGSKR